MSLLTAGRRWVVAIIATGAVAAASITVALASGHSGPHRVVVRHGEVWLEGDITQDTCDMSKTHIPVGDVGCSITVNGYQVSVVQGNVAQRGMPGTVTGLDVSTDQTGRQADVYAQLTGPHSASILGAARYYARISG